MREWIIYFQIGHKNHKLDDSPCQISLPAETGDEAVRFFWSNLEGNLASIGIPGSIAGLDSVIITRIQSMPLLQGYTINQPRWMVKLNGHSYTYTQFYEAFTQLSIRRYCLNEELMADFVALGVVNSDYSRGPNYEAFEEEFKTLRRSSD